MTFRATIGVAALLGGAFLVACGGGGGGGATSPTATGTAAAAKTPAPTPFPTPQISGSTYTFADKGYAIDAPSGWQAQPNALLDRVNGRFPTDAFFAKEVVGGIQPNIAVTCLKPVAAQATTDTFRDAWKAYIELVVKGTVTPVAVTAAGQPAWAFPYVQALPERTAPGQQQVAKRDVVLVAAGCRWLITLSYPVGTDAQYTPLFDAALATLKFNG